MSDKRACRSKHYSCQSTPVREMSQCEGCGQSSTNLKLVGSEWLCNECVERSNV